MYSDNNLPAMGPRPNPDDAKPPTMKRLSRWGILPMMGLPSREKGMVPAQVRLDGQFPQKWQDFHGMAPVDFDAGSVLAHIVVRQLPVAAEDNLAAFGLPSIQMPGNPGLAPVGYLGLGDWFPSRRRTLVIRCAHAAPPHPSPAPVKAARRRSSVGFRGHGQRRRRRHHRR